MAFVVEDGTGVADANAYISVAFADAYFADRGVTAWAGTQQEKERAIVRATDYINTRYAGRFLGSPQFATQAMHFPSYYFYPFTMPENLRKATAEYALRALTADLAPDPAAVDPAGLVVRKREKIGPIEEETTYAAAVPGSAASLSLFPAYPMADALLATLLVTGFGLRTVRV